LNVIPENFLRSKKER